MTRAMLAFALVACTPKGDDSDTVVTDADTDADSDTDTDTDTDRDTDTDTTVDTDTDTDVLPECTYAIPANAHVITDDTSVTDAGYIAWVCRNKTMSYGGTGGVFFVDQRGELVLSQGGNTVYGVVGAQIHNFGDGNVIIVGDSTDVVDESEGTTVSECLGLAFDLSNAPDPGCN
jgi:hypothetical protein